MTQVRIIERPAFDIIGKQTWIDGPDNQQFGRFWETCRADGLLQTLQQIQQQNGQSAGLQTHGAVLGVSRVEQDPQKRAFYYMIAIEAEPNQLTADLDRYHVPASRWAVFECTGPMPDAIAASEIYAFTEWLPKSGCQHALAPEMEVYPPTSGGDIACEFWLPITA